MAAWLWHIHESIQAIEEDSVNESFDTYLEGRRLRQAVERNFEIIGEAIRRIRDEDPTTFRRIPASPAFIAFRNILIHVYEDIDHARVWQVIHESLPALKPEVEQLLREAEAV